MIEVEKQNQEVDLYYSADGTLIKSIVDTDDDNTEHLPVQLTEAMKNFINEKYPNARILEVDVEDDRNDWDFGYTEVDIIHNGISKDVLFNQTGKIGVCCHSGLAERNAEYHVNSIFYNG